ncbi:MAG: MliC family protein [Bacteroidales bacterium]|nr:MliC family protein [Bacteroidales bacterium]MDD4474082.1 MliC family protein [Bacteroidales bacterium]MDD5047197.1 MliC family protein [Bacteroidales bacterium]MDY0354075.1 MliC family protein [Bacteroidales bacterium]HHV04090.1 lysozyme inhibitor [Bacteroidales bacterium]
MIFLRSKMARYLQVAVLLCAVCIFFSDCRNRNIVKTTLTDTAGNVLQMEFDKTAGTAVLYFMGDTIFLKQDTMASGIRYSNPRYVYIEWQGHVTLIKDSLIVFDHE